MHRTPYPKMPPLSLCEISYEAFMAQLVARQTEDLKVASSILAEGSFTLHRSLA